MTKLYVKQVERKFCLSWVHKVLAVSKKIVLFTFSFVVLIRTDSAEGTTAQIISQAFGRLSVLDYSRP